MNNYIIMLLLYLSLFGTCSGEICNRFALCDFDNNAIPEIVLEGTHGTRRILTYHKGKIILSKSFKYRTMKTIKTDGTFEFSDGAPYYGIAKLVFENGKAKYNILCYNDLDDKEKNIYYLDNSIISEAEFNELIEKQGYKDDITWYDYSIENLEKVLLQ